MFSFELSTLVGSLGVGLLLIAFAGHQLHWLRSDGYSYLILNLSGALVACYSSLLIDFMPFVVLELVWAATAAVSLVKKAMNAGVVSD